MPSGFPSLSPEPGTAEYNSEYKQSLKTVVDNYKAINDKDFKIVHDLRTSRIRDEKDVKYYESVYSSNISISVLEAKVTSCTSDEALISVILLSHDTIDKRKIQGKYEGWFKLVKESGNWKIDDSKISPVPGTEEEIK